MSFDMRHLLTIGSFVEQLGQLKAGHSMRYRRVSLDEALKLRKQQAEYLDAVQSGIEKNSYDKIKPLNQEYEPSGDFGTAVLWEREAEGNKPHVRYRQGGDDFLTVEYGNEEFDINHRCRVTALEKAVCGSDAPSFLKENLNNTVGCCTSLMLCKYINE